MKEFDKLKCNIKRSILKGLKGEQQTMFTEDFSGNPIEFKAFQNEDEIFN